MRLFFVQCKLHNISQQISINRYFDISKINYPKMSPKYINIFYILKTISSYRNQSTD